MCRHCKQVLAVVCSNGVTFFYFRFSNIYSLQFNKVSTAIKLIKKTNKEWGLNKLIFLVVLFACLYDHMFHQTGNICII
jgi:hypothetical protein